MNIILIIAFYVFFINGIPIYMIDSGSINCDSKCIDFVNDSNLKKDCSGHGTFLHSVINKNVTHLRVMDCNTSTTSSVVIEALTYLLNLEPGIVTLSMGVKHGSNVFEEPFNKLKRLGFLIIVAAGNGNEDACDWIPASSGGITIGAVKNNIKTDYSNYGDCVNYYTSGLAIGYNLNHNLVVRSGTSVSVAIFTKILSDHIERGGILENLHYTNLNGFKIVSQQNYNPPTSQPTSQPTSSPTFQPTLEIIYPIYTWNFISENKIYTWNFTTNSPRSYWNFTEIGSNFIWNITI